MGLILDSSVVIAAERRGETPEQLVQQVINLDERCRHWSVRKERVKGPTAKLAVDFNGFSIQTQRRII